MRTQDALIERVEDREIGGNRLRDTIALEPGMWALYDAYDPATSEPVAVQVFAPPEGSRAKRRQRRLAATRMALEHPSLAPIRAMGDDHGRLFFVVGRSQSPTLEQRLGGGAFPPASVIALLGEIASALDLAASHDLVHRELCPSRVRVRVAGRAELTDFGMALVGRSITPVYRPHVAYMAPEELAYDLVDARSNVYSLGCIAFEALTGRSPFKGSVALVSYLHAAEPPPRASECARGLPPALDDVLVRAMSKEPEHRFGSAGALMEAVRGAMGESEPPPRPRAQAPRSDRATPRPSRPAANGRRAVAEGASEREGANPSQRRRAGKTVSRRRSRATQVGLVVGALALATGGYAVGTARTTEAPPVLVSSGPLSLTLPADWSSGGAGDALPGVADRSALAARRGSTGIAVWRSAERAIVRPPGTAETSATRLESVRLGRTEAYRRTGLTGAGEAITAYAIPLREGSVRVACHAPPGAARSWKLRCERVASTVRIAGAQPVRLATLAREQDGVDRSLTRLAQTRTTGRARLARARTARGQGRLARSLLLDYRSARRALAPIRAGADGGLKLAPVVAALARAEQAYRRLGQAASRRSAQRYRSAARAVGRAEADLRSALVALRR